MKSNDLIETIDNIVNNFKNLLNETDSIDIIKNVQDLQTNGVPALEVLSQEMITLSLKSVIEREINSLELFFNEVPLLQQRFDYLKQLYYSKFPTEISDLEKEEIKKFMESLNTTTSSINIDPSNIDVDLEEQLHIDKE